MQRARVFQALAIASIGPAAYHALGAIAIIAGDGAPATRHAAFVAINLGCCWYLWRRPLIGLPLFALLVAQQTMSHGSRALRLWSSGTTDWVSIILLIALYAGLVLLVLDARDRSPRVRRLVCPLPAR
jgi:hypothetical protein